MKDPLKQGLKRFVTGIGGFIEVLVEVKDPLKQGLKQIQNYSQLLLY